MWANPGPERGQLTLVGITHLGIGWCETLVNPGLTGQLTQVKGALCKIFSHLEHRGLCTVDPITMYKTCAVKRPNNIAWIH